MATLLDPTKHGRVWLHNPRLEKLHNREMGLEWWPVGLATGPGATTQSSATESPQRHNLARLSRWKRFNEWWLPGRLCNCTHSYWTTIGKSWNTSWQFPLKDNQQNLTRCSSMAQTLKGTQVLADWYFLCGHKAFLSLLAGWGGLCTLVKLSDHIFFMDRLENHPRNQNKCEINMASPNAFGVTVDTGVPREFQILPKPSPKCWSRRGAWSCGDQPICPTET